MTKCGKGRIISHLAEMCDGSGLKEPGGAVVALIVARKASETRSIEPVEVFREPFLQSGMVRFGEGFRVGEEGKPLNDLCQVHGFHDAFGAACLRWRDGLAIQKARGHSGCGINKPGSEMGDGLLSVACLVGEDEGGGQRGDADAEVEQSVAVSRKGVGIGGAAGVNDVRAGRVRRVGPVVVGLGVIVVRATGAPRAGKCNEWSWRLRYVVLGGLEDTVMVDGGNVGASRGCSLRHK